MTIESAERVACAAKTAPKSPEADIRIMTGRGVTVI